MMEQNKAMGAPSFSPYQVDGVDLVDRVDAVDREQGLGEAIAHYVHLVYSVLYPSPLESAGAERCATTALPDQLAC